MNIIKRILQDKISERIEPNKAVLLFGARRVGKTVLIRELIKEFKGQSMLLNGEDYDTIALLNERSISNYRHLLEGIDLLAIDEAQNIPEIGSKLKLIVDEVEGIKVIASGSSSFDLLNKAASPFCKAFCPDARAPLRRASSGQKCRPDTRGSAAPWPWSAP